MYQQFFGFKEKPFNLVPNPAFLFLSKSHEEAMAHLNYAISQGDGFVVLTGEVGTGKTTLCRAFLEDLKEDTEIAYVFNPKLDSIQLLKTINDEFGISSAANNTKELIDTLNTFLLEKSMAHKKILLLIDEAQNLNHDVLEQLRLLSNLETTTRKLLQIILVGQPELTEKLSAYDLRQLGQRITLNCHIRALNFSETREYIRHRIHVASTQSGPRFDVSAFRSIYRYSGGIPRLINIACDRILLTAFVLNRPTINGHIARKAIRELRGRDAASVLSLIRLPHVVVILAVLGGLAAGSALLLFDLRPRWFSELTTVADDTAGRLQTVDMPPDRGGDRSLPEAVHLTALREKRNSDNAPPESSAFVSILAALNSPDSRASALTQVVWRWDDSFQAPSPELNALDNDQTFFRLGTQHQGLELLTVENDFSLIRKLNLPAILQFYSPSKQSTVYMALTHLTKNRLSLKKDSETNAVDVHLNEMILYWTGIAYVPWKNYLTGTDVISANSADESVIALKLLLNDIGFDMDKMNTDYNATVLTAVKTIQQKNRIRVDGIVGPVTKIVLFNEKSSWPIPHLKSL